jgi:hypothetical protein
MILTLVLLAGAASAITGLIWARQRSVEEGPYHLFRCPDCGQKLRYLASKAGRPSVCPRCRQCRTLPAAPQELPRERYSSEAYLEKARSVLWRPARLTTTSLPYREGDPDRM